MVRELAKNWKVYFWYIPPVPFPVPLEYIEVEKKVPSNFFAKFVDLDPIVSAHIEFGPIFVQTSL